MNETMNDMFKKDLPNLHAWCEGYTQKTGIKIYAGNPPMGLVLEDLMGQFKEFVAKADRFIEETKKNQAQAEDVKKEKKSK